MNQRLNLLLVFLFIHFIHYQFLIVLQILILIYIHFLLFAKLNVLILLLLNSNLEKVDQGLNNRHHLELLHGHNIVDYYTQ